METELSATVAENETQEYFASYDDINTHRIMLQDTSRMSAYQRFIRDNCELFANKIVVDVGSGTGILSLLAAQAGAKHVGSSSYVMMCDMSLNVILQKCLCSLYVAILY